jgi:predicted XRE-type DNA-binding protein
MPPPISSELKGRILALGAQKWSSFMIVKELKKQNLDVSRATVQNVLKNNQFTAENQEANGPPAKKKRQPHIWTPTVIKKLKNYIASDNPLTQKEMGRRVGVPQQSVSYLIRNDLDYRKKKKVKVHHLTEAAIAQRKIRALPFYNLICNEQYKDILTMDEAMLPLNYQNGQREFFYQPNNPKNRGKKEPVASKSPSWPKQRMYAAGFGWRGQTRMYIVEAKAKVNAEYFIEHILSPMMLVDVPKLYGADANRVILHMDSARSHIARIVYQWLDDHEIKYFTKDQWLANSPELSPMDFFANGYFKEQMNKRKYSTLKGMLKIAHEEWAKIPLEMFQNSLRTWPDRVMAVHKAHGKQAPKK